jgi:hypothetical protein
LPHLYGSDPFAYNFPAAHAASLARASRSKKQLATIERANDLHATSLLCAGELHRETTFGHGFPTKAKKQGKVLNVGEPSAAMVQTHIRKFGREGTEGYGLATPGDVIALRHEGLSIAEIGRTLGIPEGTVKRRLAA